jgi:acyl-CoA synthetase (AMP-forming)/AMP-acid ligase II
VNFVRNVLIRNARSFADRDAVIDGGTRYTHVELNARVNRAANALRSTSVGCDKGTVIGLVARNCIEFVDIFFASHKLGATISAANVRYKQREFEHQLRHCGAEILFFASEFASTIEPFHQSLQVRHYICIDGPVPEWALSYSEFLSRGENADEPPQVSVVATDISSILYTSGTTGVAKGVPMRYWGGLYLGVLETNNDIGLTSDDVTLCVAPLFHQAAHGFNLLMPLSVGGTVVLQPRFDPEAALAAIEEFGVTFSFMVPTMSEAILRSPSLASRNTSSFRKLLSSGSALPERMKRSLLAAFPGLSIYENYGATESFNTARLLPSDVMRKENCAGLPLPTQQVRVVDKAGAEVAVGEIGEIIIRGPATFQGYLDPPAGAESVIDSDGWFHTGDLARRDDEGYLYIVGRSKEMIISGGENIYPREIEDVILAIPGVVECACVGLPDPYWGELVCACVVSSSPSVSGARIVEACTRELADYKKPRRVEFVDEIPRNAAGKILRRVLVEALAKREATPQPQRTAQLG